jgi:hypothetical protein
VSVEAVRELSTDPNSTACRRHSNGRLRGR